MNLESTRQDLAGTLVEREVYYCASSLMYGIAQIMWDCKNFHNAFGDHPDDMAQLYQQDDWEEPGTAYLRDDADLIELETVAENFGSWSDMLETIGYQAYLDQHEVIRETWQAKVDEIEADLEHLPTLEEFEERREELQATRDEYEECAAEEPLDLDDWLDREKLRSNLREAVIELVDDWQWVCNEFGVDPETNEVYEHWIISGWLARKLAERGEVTGNFAGLTLWGRCTTGQSISMDYVIQQIAAETWPEEWGDV